MKTELLRTILSAGVLCLYGVTFAGCSTQPPSTTSSSNGSSTSDHDHDHDGHDHDDDDHDHDAHEGHDHDEHEHDDHAGHDHAPHGPNGGHMLNLSGGSHAEWAHDDEQDLITVYAENPEVVTSVQMKTKIADSETVYDFEKKETDGATVFQLASPELLTAVKMGDAVETTLLITTAEGDATGPVQHHAH